MTFPIAAHLSRRLPLHTRRLLSTMTAPTPPPAAPTSTVTKLPLTNAPPSPTSHHVLDKAGNRLKFRNPDPSFGPPMSNFQIASAFYTARLAGEVTWPSTATTIIPSVPPHFLPTRFPPPTSLRATWLGHACALTEFPSGLRVLFDPVFEPRCSPLSFLGPSRYSPAPCAPAAIPLVDAVVISHSHYDHLSRASVVALAARHPAAQFFVGLGLAGWFRACGIERVTEMDWWEGAELVVTTEDGGRRVEARVECLPAQHTSGRTGLDKDVTLWASWAVRSGGKAVWFAGDTGYRAVPRLGAGVDDYGEEFAGLPRCPGFREIGERRGPFDLGLIPIGAYNPRFVMSPMHANPFDAVEMFKDTRCKRAIGIHWGTWVLTVEPPEEPPMVLREALKRSGIAEEGVFDVCKLGESKEY
ncbi:beta-lactamase superfamily domain-containing protein [Podospora conica]|nr:beta-lactamase superfamily domain-containing protein [Schizothecium conicum]